MPSSATAPKQMGTALKPGRKTEGSGEIRTMVARSLFQKERQGGVGTTLLSEDHVCEGGACTKRLIQKAPRKHEGRYHCWEGGAYRKRAEI